MILQAHEHHVGLKLLALTCVLLATTAGASQGGVNLVNNRGFENGVPQPGGTSTFTGWTQSGDTSSTSVVSLVSDPFILAPHGGTFEAKSGPNNLGSISQSIATIPGHTYEVSFWLAEFISFNSTPGADNTAVFQSSFAGQTLTNITTVITLQTPQSNVYMNFVKDIVATGASSILQFSFKDPPAFWLLDDVSVTTTPEASSLVVWSVLGLAGIAVGVARRQRGMSVA
jgi:hypothetical protein